MKQRILSIFLIAVLLFGAVPVFAENEPEGTHVRILFTSDMHDYYLPDKGGAARMKTLIDRYSDENTLVLDAGDFSMGTLLGAGYATDAYEMRLMGAMGIQATTFGNHEWDFGPEGVCAMLSAANASGSVLPELVASSLDLSGELTEQQEMIRERFENGQIKDAVIFDDIGGKRIAVFGVMGYDSVECAPTSGQNWADYKTAAKKMVEKLQPDADVIVCLSHSGTNGDGETGEDIDLAKEVPGIDVILSGHTHTTYPQPVLIGDTILGSCGEYNHYLGLIDLLVGEGGSVTLEDYKLIPCDTSVPEDPVIAMLVDRFQQEISDGYLKDTGYTFDEPICHSNFDMISLDEMYATHQEYTTGNMIADSYLYEAKLHGVTDIDVALVGLGTIRGSVKEGDLTAADAFEICSLGVGSDGSAGHPLLCAYVTGKELKLLTELDASLGPVVSSIKMSYAGLNYRFNTKRMLLDRVTSVGLSRSGGMLELIEDDMLYKVCCNMYAANMLGMLNGLTKGILSITPKNADGTPVEDFYACALLDEEGNEIKEWVALADYWSSFRTGDSGLPEIPAMYEQPQSRKVKFEEGGFARISNPGGVTLAAMGAVFVLILLIVLLIVLIRRTIYRRRLKHQQKGNS